MELRPGLVVADRFRLVKPLGQGGMGAVWLAQQTALDVPCALKFIHEEAAQSPELRARFEREAKAAAQLRSPHVVHILDHGVWEGAPYIAMELLEGEDLEARLGRSGTLPGRETLAIVTQVGRALAKAHAVGLVHRDLKPANIFLTRDEDREIVKVLDFGVAKVKETLDGSTKTGAVLGTPYYMSPEQARGAKSIDHRSDLWALAVVTYQCLTGQLPFNGEALGDLFVKIIVEPLPVPSQVANVSPTFDAWWARAAARDPAHRFQTAKEFGETLSIALGVTVLAGTDLGSALSASSSGQHRVHGGTVAMMTPSSPVAPYPMSSSQAPMQQAMSVSAVAPPKRSAGLIVAAVLGGAALLGAIGFFALRSPTSATSPAAAEAAPEATATATAAASATATAAPGDPPRPVPDAPTAEPEPSTRPTNPPRVRNQEPRAASKPPPAPSASPRAVRPSKPATID